MYKLPNNFYELVSDKYKCAEGVHIKFNGSEKKIEDIEETFQQSTINYQVTLLSSLQHKPDKGDRQNNPFERPEPELTIMNNYGVDGEFRIIFNKFPVVSEHFMLVTTKYKSQNSPLSLSELKASYNILSKLKDDKNNSWFAFYNCGPESGASQPHKHIQFMKMPGKFESYLEKLARTATVFIPNINEAPLQNPDIPFAHFVAPLPADVGSYEDETLSLYFASLLQSTLNCLRDNGAAHISYNVLMTTEYMALIPRSHSKYEDKLGINSCGYLGLILTKDKELQDLVIKRGSTSILLRCGFPNTKDIIDSEYKY